MAIAIWQPRGLGIGFIALGGAIASLATGVATPENLPAIGLILGNNTLILAALFALSWVLEKTGALRWLALRAASWNLGNGKLLFLLVALVTFGVSLLLTNYGATLIVTPLVFEILGLLGLSAKATFAYAFTAGFMADVSSLPLISSNLVNTIAASYANINPSHYSLVMLPVSFLAIAANLAVLLFYFWPHIPANYVNHNLNLISSARPDFNYIISRKKEQIAAENTDSIQVETDSKKTIKETIINQSNIYFDVVSGFSYTNLSPLSSSTMNVGSRFTTLVKILNFPSIQIILFSWGMYVITMSLGNYGLINAVKLISEQLAHWGLFLSIISTGFLTTILAATTNNLPAVLIHNLALESSSLIPNAIREGMVYAGIIGCVLGAKITPIGSLSVLIWLDILKCRGWQIKGYQYCYLSVILTLPVLFITLLALAFWLPILQA
jgi:arsenical pump membrane protein